MVRIAGLLKTLGDGHDCAGYVDCALVVLRGKGRYHVLIACAEWLSLVGAGTPLRHGRHEALSHSSLPCRLDVHRSMKCRSRAVPDFGPISHRPCAVGRGVASKEPVLGSDVHLGVGRGLRFGHPPALVRRRLRMARIQPNPLCPACVSCPREFADYWTWPSRGLLLAYAAKWRPCLRRWVVQFGEQHIQPLCHSRVRQNAVTQCGERQVA